MYIMVLLLFYFSQAQCKWILNRDIYIKKKTPTCIEISWTYEYGVLSSRKPAEGSGPWQVVKPVSTWRIRWEEVGKSGRGEEGACARRFKIIYILPYLSSFKMIKKTKREGKNIGPHPLPLSDPKARQFQICSRAKFPLQLNKRESPSGELAFNGLSAHAV